MEGVKTVGISELSAKAQIKARKLYDEGHEQIYAHKRRGWSVSTEVKKPYYKMVDFEA